MVPDAEHIQINKSTVYHLIIGILVVILIASVITGGFGLKTDSSLSKSKNAENTFKEYGKNIGLNGSKFDSCLDSNKYADKINKDFNDGQLAGVGGTPTFFIGKKNGKTQTLVGAQPYASFKDGIDGLLNGIINNSESTLDIQKLLGDNSPKMGSENATVVIIEFSDFQCPFCERFYTETLPLLKKNYIDKGKVQLVFRFFPLSFHNHAEKAAEAVSCAYEQGNWEEMHNKLFENQNKWSNLE